MNTNNQFSSKDNIGHSMDMSITHTSDSPDKAAEPLIHANVETPSSLRDKYLFLDEIGHGSQGKIYKAIRLDDHTTVVIKQLNINSIKTWKEYELFQREANVLKELSIEGVARFYEGIECLEDDPPCSYIVQEYIKGASLQKLINDGHRFSVHDIYDILIQILIILNKLHSHVPPVIHRDIKPSNIMISTGKDGQFRVTIIDFGAVSNPQIQGGGSTVAGTYGYMPPEQLTGKPVPQSDIYALAAVAVQLFTGQSPANLPSKDFKLIFEPEMQSYPHSVVTTLRKMLEPKVEERFADIPELIKTFKNYRNGNFFNSNIKGKIDDISEYDKKISEIESVGEEGNIALWQQLPEKTPRSIAKSYQTRLNNQVILPEPYQDSFKKQIENQLQLKSLLISELFIIMVGPVIALGAWIMTSAINMRELSGTINTIAVLFGVFWIVIGYFRFISKKNKLMKRVDFDKKIHTQDHESLIKDRISGLLEEGRKSIAIITNIEYVPFQSKEIEIIKLPVELRTSPKYTKLFSYYGYPCFRIHYRFNPPDDKRSNDIVHTFYTHSAPENHYKIGDPLSILYKISDFGSFDKVYSMPYPIPISDMSNLETIVDQSKGRSNNI